MTDVLDKNTETIETLKLTATSWIAPIMRWSMWSGDASSLTPLDVGFVESALRRRLSTLTRMSLKVANDCVGDTPHIHLVYASRHGDLNRTTAMLQDLANEEPLSPTAFSMSVLNAFAGVYSISKNEQLPSMSLSAGESSFGFGLLEACLQLANNPEVPVLFVYSDEPAPPIYGVLKEAFLPHAIAMLLSNEASVKVNCEIAESQRADFKFSVDTNTQSSTFLDCLNGSQGQWQGEGRVWTWGQHEC
jgi:hypothetical protein